MWVDCTLITITQVKPVSGNKNSTVRRLISRLSLCFSSADDMATVSHLLLPPLVISASPVLFILLPLPSSPPSLSLPETLSTNKGADLLI